MSIKVPSLGSGISYVPGSATIEVEGIDAVNTPRVIGATAEAALVLASNNGEVTWDVTLAELDPANFGSGEGLSGTLNASNNEFILRWEMESTCDLISGDNFFVAISGNDPCGSPALGDGDQGESFPLSINGVTAPYFTFIDIVSSPDKSYVGCDDSKTIDVSLLLAGGSTGTTDTLSVILPDGIGYGGGYVCNTPGKCPTYEGAQIINGEEVLSFKYPNGVTGTIDFSFDLETDTRGGCASNEIIQFLSKKAIPGLPCGSGFCGSSEVITGNEDIAISLEKPILTVDLTSLSTNTLQGPFLYTYDLDLSNTGLDTEGDVILEFYCLNAAGDDIEGSAVARDTLTSILANGTTASLSGSFTAACNPNQGMAVLVVPEYDNCYCSALNNMSDKSAGLSEIPHDKILDIYDLLDDLDDDDDGIPDADEKRVCSSNWVNIGGWTMNTGGGNSPTTSDTDATIRDQKPGPGWDNWSIPSSALTLSSTSLPQDLNEAISGDFYIEYTILPGSGKALEPTYFGWGWNDFSNTPKHDYKVAIFANTDHYTKAIIEDVSRPNDTDNYIWQNNTIGETFLSDVMDSIVFRVYLYEPTIGIGGAAITNGDILWDDFLIGGYHAPLDDCDGDGVPNKFDLDSDNDGILDGVEAGHGQPLTAGVVTGTMGNNGLDNALETIDDSGLLNYTIANTDGDAFADPYDVDSDDDGCFDAVEAAGKFFLNDVDGSGELLGGVDINGVPIVTSGGQPTATDVTDANDKTQCPCPKVRTNRHISRQVKRQ